jgi:uncharacterized SAM-binding protein YcdF (DUF218 family)
LFVIFCIIPFLTSCSKEAVSLESDYSVGNVPYDVIIVPGYPFQDTTWHDIMKNRVYWSKYLYKNNVAKNIIYSGSAVYTPFIESKIMQEYAIALGIPEENIYTESKAEHSTENLFYSVQLAKLLGFNRIAVATDPFQNILLKRFANKRNIKVDFLPINYEKIGQYEKLNLKIDPTQAYVKNFVSLPEKENFFKRLQGTFGANIDTTLYRHAYINMD